MLTDMWLLLLLSISMETNVVENQDKHAKDFSSINDVTNSETQHVKNIELQLTGFETETYKTKPNIPAFPFPTI